MANLDRESPLEAIENFDTSALVELLLIIPV